jgi:hypothetical protein
MAVTSIFARGAGQHTGVVNLLGTKGGMMFVSQSTTPTIGLTVEQRKQLLLEELRKAVIAKNDARTLEIARKLSELIEPPK